VLVDTAPPRDEREPALLSLSRLLLRRRWSLLDTTVPPSSPIAALR
jgi:hypothetical protein